MYLSFTFSYHLIRYYMTWKTANQKMFKKWWIIFWTSLATAMIYIISVIIRVSFSYYRIPNSIDICAGFDYGSPYVSTPVPGALIWGSYLFTINFSGFLSDIFLIRFFHLRRKTQPIQLGPDLKNTC